MAMRGLDGVSILVVDDLRMPRLDGHELLYQFQRDERLSDIPFVATTGLGADTDVLYTCLQGFSGHLVKPIEPGMVDALLEGVLRRRPPAARP